MATALEQLEAKVDNLCGIVEVILGRMEAQDLTTSKIKRAVRALTEMRAPRHTDMGALADIRQELQEENDKEEMTR